MPDVLPKLVELVETFHRNVDEYRNPAFKEAMLRQQFVDPLFRCLGWDMDNAQGYAEAYKDVIHEASLKIGDHTKAPDYCFRVGGTPKFYLEAKKPSVNIKDDPVPAYQLRRYGWSRKLPISILTDFEEFAVYDCRIKPSETDKASVARIMYFRYEDYEKQWPELLALFSKDAILKGSFDRYADSKKAKRGTATVDAAFLEEIESWRLELAKNIALRNPTIGHRELNYAVQMTIDRIIFLRMCEDRGIEVYGQLRKLTEDAEVYPELCKLFRKADQRYNSGLFHFGVEKGRDEGHDTLTPSLDIDDKILKPILKSLYYPQCPYEFSVLPADILGQVYEQFLGKVIRLTDGHQAKVEEKPEVKKAGGVYYTPTYIVEYIVKNTVGKLLEGKTPKQVAKITVLDPACGSGSFLLGAYDYILKWHLDYYTNNEPEKHAKAVFQAGVGWKLTTAERKRILVNNIYGVDIDTQAVEVTKLSLLLKVLEGESPETLKSQLTFTRERALPDLAGNIKCGNSLIGPDFYISQQGVLFDDEEKYRINVFDWKKGFPAIMKAGGFDAVIGNPPYVRIQAMKEWAPIEVDAYKTMYISAKQGNYDIYVVFIEKSLALLAPSGYLGFICPHKFFNAQYGQGIRSIIAEGRHLSHVVHFGDQQVFASAMTYTCLLFLGKDAQRQCRYSSVIDVKSWPENGIRFEGNIHCSSIASDPWNFNHGNLSVLVRKLSSMPHKLKDVAARIFQGLITGADSVFILERMGTREYYSQAMAKSYRLERKLMHPLCKGSVNIRRYHVNELTKAILFPYAIASDGVRLLTPSELESNYPNVWMYLNDCKKLLESRERGSWKHARWYALGRSQNLNRMEQSKIMTPCIARRASFAIDIDDHFYFVGSGGGGGGGYGITLDPRRNLDPKYVLALLNSKLIDNYLKSHSTPFANGYFAYNRQYIENVPIRIVDPGLRTEMEPYQSIVKHVESILGLYPKLIGAKTPHEKSVLQAQIDATDAAIDALVYELYGLTDEEIGIVEAATAR